MPVTRLARADADGDVIDYQGRKLAPRNRSFHEGQQPVSSLSDFTEAVQDLVAGMVLAGSNVTKTYDDTAGTLTIASTGGTGGGVDAETVRDIIGSTVVGSGMVQVVVNDAADTVTIQASPALTAALAAKADLVSGKLDVNQVPVLMASMVSDFIDETKDIVGEMVVQAGGTYSDADGTITFPAGGGTGSNFDLRTKLLLAANSGLIKTDNADGTVTLRLDTPGPIPTNFPARVFYAQNANGSWPAFVNAPKDLIGNTPPPVNTPNLIDGVDLMVQRPGSTAPAMVTPIELTNSSLVTNNWSMGTLPAGIVAGNVLTFSVNFPTQPAAGNEPVLKIGTTTITHATPISAASGYSAYYYSVTTTAAMGGAAVTLSVPTTFTNAVRMVGAGLIISSLSSATPSGSARSGVSGTAGSAATSNVRTGTTLAVGTGFVVEIDFISTISSTAAAITNYAAASGWTRVADVYHSTSTPYQAMAVAVKLTPVQSATIGGVQWTSTDATGASTSGYGATSVIALPVATGGSGAGNATRLLLNNGAWIVVEG